MTVRNKQDISTVMEKCLENNRSHKRITVQLIVDVLIWFAVAVPVLYLFVGGRPYNRGFFCDDQSIQYPYKPDTISTTVLIAAGFGISLVVVVIVEVLNLIDRRCRRTCSSVELLYCVKGYAVFLVGFIIQQLVVELVKNQVGSLRPNFMDVCRPQFNKTNCPGTFRYITNYTCTATEHNADELDDSRRSFPSGHAAFSMYIALYCCMYMQQRLRVHFSYLLKVMLQMSLLLTSILCGITRVRDNKHHTSDVMVGFIVGSVVAIAIYKTIGQRILTFNNGNNGGTHENEHLEMIKTTNCCCSGTITPEVSTPTPLLQHEYQIGVLNETPQTHKLQNGPFGSRRHMSTPMTPTYRAVGI